MPRGDQSTDADAQHWNDAQDDGASPGIVPRCVRGDGPICQAQDHAADDRSRDRVVAGLVDADGFLPRDAARAGPRFAASRCADVVIGDAACAGNGQGHPSASKAPSTSVRDSARSFRGGLLAYRYGHDVSRVRRRQQDVAQDIGQLRRTLTSRPMCWEQAMRWPTPWAGTLRCCWRSRTCPVVRVPSDARRCRAVRDGGRTRRARSRPSICRRCHGPRAS